jgi:hypothetical protein
MSAGLLPAASEVPVAFAVHGGSLYLGADRPIIGSGTRSAIARWVDVIGAWVLVAPDPTATTGHSVLDMVEVGGTLYAAGAGLGQSAGRYCPLATVGPSAFAPVTQITSGIPIGACTSLRVYGGVLHAAGDFDRVGTHFTVGFARLSAGTWEPVGPWLSGPISDMAEFQDELVLAGDQYADYTYPLLWTRWHCPVTCYANCDGSTTAPILNVQDFACFLNRFASADPYANCDHSTAPPVLNVQDFSCFLNAFAAGCP